MLDSRLTPGIMALSVMSDSRHTAGGPLIYCPAVNFEPPDSHARAAATHILICSHDPRLLETRQLVLERAGFRVTAVAEIAQVEAIVKARPVDICVLCQTLSSAECEGILETVRVHTQEIKYVVIAAHESHCADLAAAGDAVLDGFVFPQLLVAEVQKLAGIQPSA